jgi:uncharacterized Zn-finger protein
MVASATRISETVEVDTIEVACDGGEASTGHPRVFLHIEPETRDVVCPYCSRHFVLKAGVPVTGEATH